MTTLFIALKISALLTAMLVPVFGPKIKKEKLVGNSNLHVNEFGNLVYITDDSINSLK